MSLSLFTNSISEDVGQRLAIALRERFGDLSSPAKRLARMLGVSEPTARSMFQGKLPATPTFLEALDALGPKIAAGVLERIVGKQEASTLRLHAVETSLRELAEHVEAIRVDNRAGRDGVARILGFGPAGADLPDSAGRARAIGAGAIAEPDRQQDQPGEAVALVSTRRPFDSIGHDAEIRRLLSFGNVVSLDAARNLKASSRKLGLAWRKPGEEWTVDPAADNRLWKGSVGPRPLSAFPSHSYAETVRQGFDEAVASENPIAFCHAGFLDGEHIHALVGRKGWVTPDGFECVAAAFERIAA